MRENPVLAGIARPHKLPLEVTIVPNTGRGRKPKPPTDPGPFRSRSLAPIGWIVAAVLAAAGALLYLTAPEERIKVRGADTASDKPIPAPPPLPPPPRPLVRAEPDTPGDLIGRAKDLKAVYQRYRDSQNPIERGLAGRAHRACFPMFLPAQGQAPSTVHLKNALGKEQRERRGAAIDEMFARCRSFLVPPLDNAEIVSTAERASNGDLAAAGASARWAMMRGDRAKADAIVDQALRSREPYAIHSLVGMSLLMMNEGASGRSPDVTDAALVLVACDLGAACGPDSLLALQLCAAEGRCDGSARERLIARIGSVDMEAVETERKRLQALFDRSNATIATVWRGGR